MRLLWNFVALYSLILWFIGMYYDTEYLAPMICAFSSMILSDMCEIREKIDNLGKIRKIEMSSEDEFREILKKIP